MIGSVRENLTYARRSLWIALLNMEDIRPTAKWANRMLRPLTSIFRRLEKHQENLSIVASSRLKQTAEACDPDSVRPSRIPVSGDGDTYSDGEGEDPAWVPGKLVNRRLRHKYSTRVQGNGGRRRNRVSIRSPELHKTLLPGAIEIATPLITGKSREPLERSSQKQQLKVPGLRDIVPGAVNGRNGLRMRNKKFPAHHGSWKEVIDMSGDTEFVAIARLLDRIFLKFLNNTRVQILPWEQTRGTRSLLSMAVRHLPEFIEDEQTIQDDVDNDCDVDMCDMYFYELEAHYAPGGGGWQPLREAVRAQGIYLVSEMLQRQWVTKLAACRLLEECVKHYEFDAFELLSSKYLSTVDAYQYPTAFDPHRPPGHCDDPIHLLGTYYTRSCGRRSFVFDQMAELLLRGVVAPEWMVTRPWKKCVDGAITSLSAQDPNSTAARRLIEAIILTAANTYPEIDTIAVHTKRLGMSHPVRLKATHASATNALVPSNSRVPCPIPIQDALSNLTLSLMAALCSMHIARSNSPATEEKAVGTKIRKFVQSLAFTVEREVEIRQPSSGADRSTCQLLRQGCVLLGRCLLEQGEDDFNTIRGPDSSSRQNTRAFLLVLSSRQDVIKELATMVRQVFRCYEHVHKSDQTRTSPEIRGKVSQLVGLGGDERLSTFLGKVAVETAMSLAETTGDPDDHVWAVEIQEKVMSLQQENGMRHEEAHGRMDNSSGLYRWEEGIGEWVARTPMWKARAVEVPSKHVEAIRRPPSTIADSATSDSPTVSPPGGYASSITSSAPSVSTKRGRSDSEPRSSKRRCSTPVEEYPDRKSESTDDTESLASHQTCELVSATPAASKYTRYDATKGILHRDIDQPVSSIEVVLVNRRGSTKSRDSAAQESAASDHRTPRANTSRLAVARSKYARRRATVAPPRASRMRPVIPCSQEDGSDDELSFF